MSWYDTEAYALSEIDECSGPHYIWDDEDDIRNRIWTQRNGRRIKVSDMDSHHIYNTINHLRGIHINSAYRWIDIFENELLNRRDTNAKS